MALLRRGGRARRHAPAYAVLAIALLMTMGFRFVAQQSAARLQRERLEHIAEDLSIRILGRVQVERVTLEGVRAMLRARQGSNEFAFSRYSSDILRARVDERLDALSLIRATNDEVWVAYSVSRTLTSEAIEAELTQFDDLQGALHRSEDRCEVWSAGRRITWMFLSLQGERTLSDRVAPRRGTLDVLGVRLANDHLFGSLLREDDAAKIGYAILGDPPKRLVLYQRGDPHDIAAGNPRLLGMSVNRLASEPDRGDPSRHVFLPLSVGERDWTLLVFVQRGEALTPGAGWDPDLLTSVGIIASLLLFGLALRQSSARIAAEELSTQLVVSRRALAESKSTVEHERQRAALLADVGARLHFQLRDIDVAMRAIARIAVPTLGDACVVAVLEDNRFRHIVAVQSDLASESSLQRAFTAERIANDPSIMDAMRSGTNAVASLTAAEGTASIASPGDAHALPEEVRRLGMKETLVVPLRDPHQGLGVMVFLSRTEGRFGADERALSAEVARRSSLAIENAQLIEQVQQAIRTRDEFLSVAAHELKTPITAIKGYAQLMRLWTPEEIQRKGPRALAILDRQADRLHRLVQGLLEISRVQLGRLRLHREPTELRAFVQDAIEAIETLTPKVRIQFHESRTVYVDIDRIRIEQVITNLLSNALRFSPVDRDVVVRFAIEDQCVIVSIQDFGIGIPKSQEAHVFEQFGGVHGTTPYAAVAGLGVGLYISKQFVDRHGGRIWFESEEGKGTTFFFSLPIAGEPHEGDELHGST